MRRQAIQCLATLTKCCQRRSRIAYEVPLARRKLSVSIAKTRESARRFPDSDLASISQCMRLKDGAHDY